jgi:2,4-diaminopentanoate dehydrogenase
VAPSQPTRDHTPWRVVQWTTGIVGSSSLRAIVDHPHLQLVGCFTHSADKVGVDSGLLCGIQPTGIMATDDAAAILDLAPDCVVYMPQWPDLSEIEFLLRAGINVVTSARLVNGRHYDEGAGERLVAAALEGHASLYGSGCNPMFVPTVALASTAMCRQVDQLTITESMDCGLYTSAENWKAYGFGTPPEPQRLRDELWRLEPDYREALEIMAAGLAIAVDDFSLDVTCAVANEDRNLGFMDIPEGTVAALDARWSALVNGLPVVTIRTTWKLGSFLGYTETPDWPLLWGYLIEVQGEPNIRLKLNFTFNDLDNIDIGVTTAMPIVNAIASVCAARPGVLSPLDLPLVTGRHVSP